VTTQSTLVPRYQAVSEITALQYGAMLYRFFTFLHGENSKNPVK
jgi:hypothetical protein